MPNTKKLTQNMENLYNEILTIKEEIKTESKIKKKKIIENINKKYKYNKPLPTQNKESITIYNTIQKLFIKKILNKKIKYKTKKQNKRKKLKEQKYNNYLEKINKKII